ncbi:hypothetical protein GLAREA_12280 [Glarea lozoyensis ATCC 20868]|uniref:Glycoprotease family protein n=1 Tax=Glarea lozoyensis (strain ATCC 20868 / MF5171) TaxID=1116229 RepID=S3D2X8_GLAL2|nr:uncharacterized protein GLAREA_12280 [Glarea lozoyensis ATCC 20868]EPE31524.1 hypothetical protein GLAREA_12280 [Glarea lozoyensis ATCC 20868]
MSAANGSFSNPYKPNQPRTKLTTNAPATNLDDEDDDYEWWDDDDESILSGEVAKSANKSRMLRPNDLNANSKPLTRRTTKKLEKRYSVVQKPARNKSRWMKKKLQAQAGIQLVTDFSTRHRATTTQPQHQRKESNVGKFIDLAALEAANNEKTPREAGGGFWRSKKNKGETTAHVEPLPERNRSTNLMPAPHDPTLDLSPMDRPIYIGFTIPTSDMPVYTTSPQTASSETANIVQSYEQRTPTLHVPETPTIIITPAIENSTWSPIDEGDRYNGNTRTATSSFYSQASVEQYQAHAPPVPRLPAGFVQDEQKRLAAQKSCFSPDSDDGTVWEDVSAHTSRVVSSCTVFEEDISPVMARKGRAISVADGFRSGRHASISTVATRRQSKGWWNYITTPFLTRSNTIIAPEATPQQPPALPSLAVAAAAAYGTTRDQKSWEKQFSPVTPETSTTIQSDAWWNTEPLDGKSPVGVTIDPRTGHKSQPSTASVPFILADGVFPQPPNQDAYRTMSSPQSASPISPFPSSHSSNSNIYQIRGTQGNDIQQIPRNTIDNDPRSKNRALSGPVFYGQEQHQSIAEHQARVYADFVRDQESLPGSPHQSGGMHSNNPFTQTQRQISTYEPTQISLAAAQSNNPYTQPRRVDPIPSFSDTSSIRRQATQPSPVVVLQPPPTVIVNVQSGQPRSPIATPPPAYSPPPGHVPRYRAFFPPGHTLHSSNQEPMSPGPITPGMRNAMGGSGAMQMSEVPRTSPGRGLPASPAPIRGLPSSPAPSRGPINLNSSYPADLPPRDNAAGTFVTADSFRSQSSKARRAEAKRRRNEKEDAVACKAGGLWRGRGCIPKNGCYGRKGPEGRKRRRWYLALIVLFLIIIGLAIGLAIGLHQRPSPDIEPSQWVNITGFPPIFAGMSTIIAPINTAAVTGCVIPATLWSCSLPKEVQPSVAPNSGNQPNFLLNIEWDNSTEANATFANVTGNPNLAIRSFAGNAVSAGQLVRHLFHKAKRATTIVSSPPPPLLREQSFLGNTTDGVISANKAGEPTPFYISLLPAVKPANVKRRAVEARQASDNTSSPLPDLGLIIPPPSLNADGSAAPAVLLPLPTQQPLRLYDRGLPTEHYGFYTFHDRSIFLKSAEVLNSTDISDSEVPADLNGGAEVDQAAFRCTWTDTRFLVQIWTRMNTTARLLNSTHPTAGRNASTDFLQPGSFPYPVTITSDRHGGDQRKKMIYCYRLDNRGGLIADSSKIMQEERAFGGVVFNPAATLFGNGTDDGSGGIDGGSAGCKCKWDNFEGIFGNSRRSSGVGLVD